MEIFIIIIMLILFYFLWGLFHILNVYGPYWGWVKIKREILVEHKAFIQAFFITIIITIIILAFN